MASNKGLGRGLGALLGDFEETTPQESPYKLVPIHKVEPNYQQPRQDFDDMELMSLAESIEMHGIIQPLTVRPLLNGGYQIVAGERRWRAARMAKLDEIPVIVIEADNRKVMELALIENLQRMDLNPIEEAWGYRSLIDEHDMTQEEAADRVGKSRSAVTNTLRLLNLPSEVQDKLRSGELSAGHARALLVLKDEKKMIQAAQKIIALGLSVRQAELLCKNMTREPAPEPKVTLTVDYIGECEKTLSKHLGRGVKIVNGKRKGKFELEFYGQEDLQVLLDALMAIKK